MLGFASLRMKILYPQHAFFTLTSDFYSFYEYSAAEHFEHLYDAGLVRKWTVSSAH